MKKILWIVAAGWLAVAGCSKDEPKAAPKVGPGGHFELPTVSAMGSFKGGRCRVLIAARTRAGTFGDEGEMSAATQVVRLWPHGGDRTGVVMEVEGWHFQIGSAREVYDILKGFVADGKATRIDVHAREDTCWQHVVAACAAAQGAGPEQTCLQGLPVSVERLPDDQPAGQWDPSRRLVLAVTSAGGPQDAPLRRASAGRWWIGDRRSPLGDVDGAARWVRRHMKAAESQGRNEVTVEVRADRHLYWLEVSDLLQSLASFVLVRPTVITGRGPHDGLRSSFFGSGGNAHHVVYAIDRSGSMVETFDTVRTEMLISISRLSPKQDFHVILFAKGPPLEAAARRLSVASRMNKGAAAKFLEDVRAQGQTDAIPALKRAFAVLARADKRRGRKLIYLLTDGNFPDNAAVLAAIRKLNKDKKVSINTYLYGRRPPEAEKVMRLIAKENKGRYKYVSADE